MKQVERIILMERNLNLVQEAVRALGEALDKMEAAEEAVATLSTYYGSPLWKQDLAADEAGRLPQDLKRGVLSEDGIWDVLEAWRELHVRIGASKR